MATDISWSRRISGRKYIDPKYRERAMRIRVGDDGYEYLEIDRKRAKMTQPGVLGSLGGMGKNIKEAQQLREAMMSGKLRPEQARMMRPSRSTPT